MSIHQSRGFRMTAAQRPDPQYWSPRVIDHSVGVHLPKYRIYDSLDRMLCLRFS